MAGVYQLFFLKINLVRIYEPRIFTVQITTTMKKYVKKPVKIEAVQLTRENVFDVLSWANDILPKEKRLFFHSEGISILTKEGKMICGWGDFLIKEPFPTDDRMFYPCKADMFQLTYDEIM